MNKSTYKKLDKQQTRICGLASTETAKGRSKEMADIASKLQEVKEEVDE